MKDHKTLIRISMRKPYEKSSRNKCDLCGNEFKSEKALCGHMRCHPERSWRGLKPPPAASPAADAAGGADGVLLSDPPAVADCNDNRPSVPRWLATDKRGRKCVKKRKMIMSKERVEEAQIEQLQVTYSEESDERGLRRMLDFDLNELPPVDDDGEVRI